jgi:hypothetical protein
MQGTLVINPTTADVLSLDSSRAVLAATMVRIEIPLHCIPERLLTTGQRSNTSSGRARKHLEPTTTGVEYCECDISYLLSHLMPCRQITC